MLSINRAPVGYGVHVNANHRKAPRFAALPTLLAPSTRGEIILLNGVVQHIYHYSSQWDGLPYYKIRTSILPEKAIKYDVPQNLTFKLPANTMIQERVKVGQELPLVLIPKRKWFGGMGYKVKVDEARLMMPDTARLEEEG